MAKHHFTKIVSAALLIAAVPVSAQDKSYVYTKLPLSKEGGGVEEIVLSPEDTVLVEIRIRRGDSLWKFAKRTLKHPSHYAQLLAYNPSIRNPHRIIAGETILVPDGLLKNRRDASSVVLTRWVVTVPKSMLATSEKSSRPRATATEALRVSPAPAQTVRAKRATGDSHMATLKESERLYRKGRYEEAVGRLESLLGSTTDAGLRARAEFLLAECYRMLSGGR